MKLKPPKWLTAEYFKDWIIQQQVLETVLGENTHLEIVKRSGCILKFLAKLGALPPDSIDLIWKCQLGKHEEMVRVVYNIIKELVPYISLENIDILYSKIQTVPPKSFDEKFLNFLKDFTIKALENYFETKNNEMSMSETQPCDFEEVCNQREMSILMNLQDHISTPNSGLHGNEKLYGLPLFWDLAQDRSQQVSKDLMELAITSIIEILKLPSSKHIRMTYIIKSLENIQNCESVVQSITIIQHIVSEFNEFQYQENSVSSPLAIVQMQKQFNIV